MERECRRGGNGGLNLYSSLFSISRTCRKLHGQLWIMPQATALDGKCPYYSVTCIYVSACVICHGSSFKPASPLQDILATLDSQSVSHSHCENRLSVRSLKPMHHRAQHSNIRSHPPQLYTRKCHGNYISFLCPRTNPLPQSLFVRPLAGGQPWLIEQQRSEWLSII